VPIPLGGIAIQRKIEKDISVKVNRLIKKSLEHAFAQYPTVTDYVKAHSQTMSEEVMRQHIDLYVNNFSLGLGKEGREAIKTLYNVFSQTQSLSATTHDLFL
jgi:1,4-dihydroxy-6-naphthoate synthase